MAVPDLRGNPKKRCTAGESPLSKCPELTVRRRSCKKFSYISALTPSSLLHNLRIGQKPLRSRAVKSRWRRVLRSPPRARPPPRPARAPRACSRAAARARAARSVLDTPSTVSSETAMNGESADNADFRRFKKTICAHLRIKKVEFFYNANRNID